MVNAKELIRYTKNLSVLFVEDHDELRENTAEILSSFFKTVTSSENGQKAIDLYCEYYLKNGVTYDIVLSDIQMPTLNGIELTEQIYDINPLQIVIILSAYDDSKYLLPLINLGIEQFVKKPIDFQELLEILYDASKKLIKIPIFSIENSKIHLSKTYTYSRENKSLYNKDESIYLTKYEIIFLQILTMKVGKIYSNEDISAEYLEQQESMDTQNIRKLVSKLRKKLPDNLLESIYGIGYRLVPYLKD
jgi:DNA-binding response OmpR family regulator